MNECSSDSLGGMAVLLINLEHTLDRSLVHIPLKSWAHLGIVYCEDLWDDGYCTNVRQIDVVSGSAVESITLSYDQGSFAHGTSGGGTTIRCRCY